LVSLVAKVSKSQQSRRSVIVPAPSLHGKFAFPMTR
jgi:hypothetical protein